MKEFNDFLKHLAAHPNAMETAKEYLIRRDDKGFVPNEREADLAQYIMTISAVTVRETLRQYHEWLETSE